VMEPVTCDAIDVRCAYDLQLKVKVKVTQGHISMLYAKCSGLHGESRIVPKWPRKSRSMSLKVKYRLYIQIIPCCMGSRTEVTRWPWESRSRSPNVKYRHYTLNVPDCAGSLAVVSEWPWKWQARSFKSNVLITGEIFRSFTRSQVMTFSIKVKVIRGHITTKHAKWSGLHGKLG
jgi:hypothetical protein